MSIPWILMMEAVEIYETLAFSSTLTRLIAREDFSKLDMKLEILSSEGGDYVIYWTRRVLLASL
jgi:hypothetical protein